MLKNFLQNIGYSYVFSCAVSSLGVDVSVLVITQLKCKKNKESFFSEKYFFIF